MSVDGDSISTLDLVKQNFVLVAAEDDSPWLAAAKELRFKIDTYVLHETSQPYPDTQGKLNEKIKLGTGQALLVRPDGFIAWRPINTQSSHKVLLQQALERIPGQAVE